MNGNVRLRHPNGMVAPALRMGRNKARLPALRRGRDKPRLAALRTGWNNARLAALRTGRDNARLPACAPWLGCCRRERQALHGHDGDGDFQPR